jgi:ketosteroid isomerase-like protein
MDIKETIEKMNLAYSKAYNAGDAEGVVALFAENAILMPPNQPMIQGREALLSFYRKRVQKNRGYTLNNKLVEFKSEGNLVYQVATYSIAGENVYAQGKFIITMQRQGDTTLKYTTAIYNTDMVTAVRPASSGLKRKDLEIFNTMPVIFRVKDVEGKYLWVNRTLAEMAEQEIIGKTDYELHWSNDPQALSAADQNVLETKKPLYVNETIEFPGCGKVTLSVCKFAGEFEGKKCSLGIALFT